MMNPPAETVSPFQVLLLNIGKNLETNDLSQLRLLLKGRVPGAVLEDTTTIALMGILQDGGLIEENDTRFLEELLEHIGKSSLKKYIKEYKASLAKQQTTLPTDAQATGTRTGQSASSIDRNEGTQDLSTPGGHPEVRPTLPETATQQISPNFPPLQGGGMRQALHESTLVKPVFPQTSGRPPDPGHPPARQPRAITNKQPSIYPLEQREERYPLNFQENDRHNVNRAQGTPPGLTTPGPRQGPCLSLTENDFQAMKISTVDKRGSEGSMESAERSQAEDYDSMEVLKRNARERATNPPGEGDTVDLRKQKQAASSMSRGDLQVGRYVEQVHKENEQVQGEMVEKHNLGDQVNSRIACDGGPHESINSAGSWDDNFSKKIHTDSPRVDDDEGHLDSVTYHPGYPVPEKFAVTMGTGKASGKIHTDSPQPDPASPPVTLDLHSKGARPKQTVQNQSVLDIVSPRRIQEPTSLRMFKRSGSNEHMLGSRTEDNESNIPIQPYGYQLELAEPALDGQNCILFAPTGSGKTVTAGYVCDQQQIEAKAEGRPFKALFIVCNRNLIIPKQDTLRQLLTRDDPYNLVGRINETESLTEMYKRFDVIVLTAKFLVDCLNKREVSLQQFNLLMVDECHHTTDKGHPYKIIIQHYHEEKRFAASSRLPQILGLTASLGVGANKDNALEHYILMCANLDCTKITHVRKQANLDKLLRQNPKPKKDQIIGESPRDPNDMFVLILSYMMEEIEMKTPMLPQTKPQVATEEYVNWIAQHCKTAKKNAIYACVTLQKINTTLMLYDELPGKHVLPILQEHFADTQRSEEPPPLEAMIHDLFDGQRQELVELTESETLDDNMKLRRLTELLIDLFLATPGAKGLLLMRTPLSVEGFMAFINTVDTPTALIRPAKFTGDKGEETDTDQDLNLLCFREDGAESFNLLVATDVAQEGLDMLQCNFVIRYNFVSNEIGSVQSKGQARAKNCECYLIVNRNSKEESRELENLQKEHVMMEALSEIDHIDQREINKSISKIRVELFDRNVMQQKRKSVDMDNLGCGKVTVHCKNCKAQLCDGAELRRRGSNIVALHVGMSGIESNVHVREYHSKRDMRDHIQLGELLCAKSSCRQRVGHRVVHKSEDGHHGNMLSQNAVVWKHKEQGTFRQVKKWADVPFSIGQD